MAVIAIPEPIREKLGPEGAQALVDLLNRTAHQGREDTVSLAAERFERRLAEEIGRLRSDVGSDIAAVRVEIAATRAELIRWMFIFWVGQVGATLGILFAFFQS